MQLSTFISSFIGIQGTGDTPINQGQCVGLVEKWLTVNGKPRIGGNAKDLLNYADRTAYTVIANAPLNAPKPGDVLVWDGTWGGGYGHCAVVIAASRMLVAVFEQNNPLGNPPTVSTHTYSGVAGWIHFK